MDKMDEPIRGTVGQLMPGKGWGKVSLPLNADLILKPQLQILMS